MLKLMGKKTFTVLRLKGFFITHLFVSLRPENPPVKGMWKGVSMTGKSGFFDPCNAVPFVEPISSPVTPSPKKPVSRKGMSHFLSLIVILIYEANFLSKTH